MIDSAAISVSAGQKRPRGQGLFIIIRIAADQ